MRFIELNSKRTIPQSKYFCSALFSLYYIGVAVHISHVYY